jgi:hypothetical protein
MRYIRVCGSERGNVLETGRNLGGTEVISARGKMKIE